MALAPAALLRLHGISHKACLIPSPRTVDRSSLSLPSTSGRLFGSKSKSSRSSHSLGFRVSSRRATQTVAATELAAAEPLEDLREKAESYFSADNRPVILFDGVCNLCNGGVNFMLDHDPKGTVRFAALQSVAGRALLARSGRSPDDISSIVLVEKERSYVKSDAILRIGGYLEAPLAILAGLGFIAPRFVRDGVYDVVANNRYAIMGKRNDCRLADDGLMERFIV